MTRSCEPPCLRPARTRGLEVVAETNNGADAAEMVRRFGVDVLVIDVALSDGSGEHTLSTLDTDDCDAAVVVFSAYAPDRAKLRRLGVTTVVDKPDVAQLREVLSELGSSLDATRARWPTAGRPAGRSSRPRSCGDPRPACRPTRTSPTRSSAWRWAMRCSPSPSSASTASRRTSARSSRPTAGWPSPAPDAPSCGSRTSSMRRRTAGDRRPVRGGDARAAGAVWSRLTAGCAGHRFPARCKGAAGPGRRRRRRRRRRPRGRRAPAQRRWAARAFVSVYA